MRKLFKVSVLLAITICLIFPAVSCSSYKDPVIAECNGLDINRSTLLLRMKAIVSELYNNEINDENIEDIKKETIESLKVYTYYKQGYKDLKFTLSQDDRIKLRSSVLESLMALGLKYKESKRNEIFMDNFGVSYEQFMTYHEEVALSEHFYEVKLKEINVPDVKTEEYFLKNKDKYISCKADVVYIEGENPDETAEAIKNKFSAGKSLRSITDEYSKSIKRSGTFVINKTSNMDKYFGDGLIKKILDSNENDVVIIKTENGISIAKNIEILGYEENKNDIIDIIRKDIFAEMLKEEISSENYTVNIIDKNSYDEIFTVPK